ncbi:MAG: hypothetical protein ACP6IY_22465 [Promethearchaeia archaeon]
MISVNEYADYYGYLLLWDSNYIVMQKYFEKIIDRNINNYIKENIDNIIITKLYKIKKNISYEKNKKNEIRKNSFLSIEKRLNLFTKYNSLYLQELEKLNND